MMYAGLHFPNGREDWGRIMALPSPLLLMLASEARYHYDDARTLGKVVIWRALPRVGKRPAEIGWSKLTKNADEVMNLWDEQPHHGEEWFVPYNELDLQDERGDREDDFGGLRDRYHLLTSFLHGMYTELRRRLPAETKILFPPFTPDHGDIDNADIWEGVARVYDGLVVHAYDDPRKARERLIWYLETFPEKPIFVGEWNSPDPAAFLAMLKDLEATYPNFRGATYYSWHWYNAPGYWPDAYNVDRNPDLYQLLLSAQPITKEPPAMPSPSDTTRQEKIDLIVSIAREMGEDPVEILGGGFAESGINLDRWERYGEWPDVSFGAFQQTVLYADEGDHTPSPQNIEYVKGVYFDLDHATRVAIRQFKYWRHDPDVSAAQAWCGYNGGAYFYRNWQSSPNLGNYQWGLQKAAEELGAVTAPPPARTWGPDVPDILVQQQNDWSCAVRSTYAALWAMSQQGLIEPVTYGDDGPRDVYNLLVPTYDESTNGLKDASGAGIVAALAKWGITAHNQAVVTLAEVQAKAGTCPVLIGGRAWYHWVYVRGVEDDGTLILENPSPGYKNIRFQLRDSFATLGPFSMVWIDVQAAPPPPAPPPPSPHQFLFGFADTARELGHDVVGDPIEDEHALDDRFNIQRTTSGMMIYSKAENRVTFIKG